jgi:hypothetical protein
MFHISFSEVAKLSWIFLSLTVEEEERRLSLIGSCGEKFFWEEFRVGRSRRRLGSWLIV